jgi:hypothetical protein
MRSKIALILILLSTWYAFPAGAAETTPVKCGVNEERVWVYDSLNSFDVAVKLKCGEPVEIISREKGYVKIRTSNGREGYVPEKALPKPPDPEAKNQNPSDAQDSKPQARQSVAAASPSKIASSSVPSADAKPPESTSLKANLSISAVAAGSPASVPDSKDNPSLAAKTNPGSTKGASPATAPTGVRNPEKAGAQPIPSNSQPKPKTYVAAHSTAKTADSPSSSPKTAPAAQSKSKTGNSSAVVPTSTKRTTTKTSSSKTATVSNISTGPEAANTPAGMELADNMSVESPAVIGTVRVAASPRDPDEEEDPSVQPPGSNEACRIYFSAYGLSPNQYKWMTRSRGKSFSGICPAPSPAMVDFVVIFTHDVDFYNGTMPAPVHTDKNGFSDFTPLSTIDTAVVSASDADKSRREYVWIFHTKRGTFDPTKFSPKRRPLFSTTEANKLGSAAASRSAEDALRFIEQHGADH